MPIFVVPGKINISLYKPGMYEEVKFNEMIHWTQRQKRNNLYWEGEKGSGKGRKVGESPSISLKNLHKH